MTTDLDKKAELRVLFQGSCGTTDPIATVIVLPPPTDGGQPVLVPLLPVGAEKWDVICDICRQASTD